MVCLKLITLTVYKKFCICNQIKSVRKLLTTHWSTVMRILKLDGNDSSFYIILY